MRWSLAPEAVGVTIHPRELLVLAIHLPETGASMGQQFGEVLVLNPSYVFRFGLWRNTRIASGAKYRALLGERVPC